MSEAKVKIKRARSVRELVSMRFKILPLSGNFGLAFGEPEDSGLWFVWGNSGNGKTSFVMQLCKELTRVGTVLYNSLEEGDSLSLANTVKIHNMIEVNRRFSIVCESVLELSERLAKRRSPKFVVIDSLQFAGMSYDDCVSLRAKYPKKLFIIISQADGGRPSGRPAGRVMYDASLKIWIEGFRAISKGRSFGELGAMTIWEERERSYWGSSINHPDGDDDKQVITD